MLRPPLISTLFPYTTLFRSSVVPAALERAPVERFVERDELRPRLALRVPVAARELQARFHRFRRSEEHTSELQSRGHLVCRLLLEKKKHKILLHSIYVN